MEDICTPVTPNTKIKPRKLKLTEKILTKSNKAIKKAHNETPIENNKKTKSSKKRPFPTNETSTVEENSSGPQAKRRKPRHATEEGQQFLKTKAKLLELEEGSSLFSSKNKKQATTTTKKTKSNQQAEAEPDLVKKKPKNKKKKKGKNKKSKAPTPPSTLSFDTDKTLSTKSKLSETEERQRKESLAYLQLWKKHRDHWKFEKLKQVWLLKHALFELAIDDDKFTLLLEYIGSIKGATGREKTLKEMEAFMADFEKKFGKLLDKNSVFNAVRTETKDASENEKKEYERARQIVQILAHD